jgi:hypothetical protein
MVSFGDMNDRQPFPPYSLQSGAVRPCTFLQILAGKSRYRSFAPLLRSSHLLLPVGQF